MSRLMIPVACLLLAAGCTQGRLTSPRTHSPDLADVYQQQVLDNLAMFVENSNSMPHVVARNESQRDAQTQSVAYTSTLDNYRNLSAVTPRATIAAEPISDPRRLSAIRSMFQKAADLHRDQGTPARAELEEQVASHASGGSHGLAVAASSTVRSKAASNSTADNERGGIKLASHQQNDRSPQQKRAAIPTPNYRSMYAGHSANREIAGQPDEASKQSAPASAPHVAAAKCGCPKCVAQRNSGLAVAKEEVVQGSKSPKSGCWYAAGQPKDVPANYDGKVGRYGKTCVWVPSSGHAQFNQLVAAVMKQTQTAPQTAQATERQAVAPAKPAASPPSYRVVAASIALNGDPLAAGRATGSVSGSTQALTRFKPVSQKTIGNEKAENVSEMVKDTIGKTIVANIEEAIEQESLPDPAFENDPLTFDRNLSLHKLAGENDVVKLDRNLPLQKFAPEKESLKFDRNLSLQALSSWEANQGEANTADKSRDSGAVRVAEQETRSFR